MNGTLAPFYYHKEITGFIDLWIEDGYTSYNELDSGLKDSLTALCIKHLGEDAYDCIIQPDDFSQTVYHLFKFIKTGQREYALDLAETMRKNAVEYFAEPLNQLFEERFQEVEVSRKIDAGLRPRQDRINGEIIWERGA